jgi:RNA polymerase sigma-70 factor (ECF subfamily)
MAEKSDENPLEDEKFVSLMTASQSHLRAFIRGLVPHLVDADDLLQEVNLALWRKRRSYDPAQDYLRWAFGFATMEIRSFRSRSAKSRLWFSDSTIELLASEWPRATSFVDDCRRALATCLQKLGHAERQVIEAKYAHQLSVKQIANNSGKPLSTVYWTLHRALESLRMCVERSQA